MREKFTRQSSDERGVSPVIGVILMVAITVILAAVIGFFVLGLGSSQQSTPQASFSYDGTNVVMDSGDNIPADELTVITDGSAVTGTSWSSTTISAGATFSATPSNSVRVVWNDPNSDQSATLAEISV